MTKLGSGAVGDTVRRFYLDLDVKFVNADYVAWLGMIVDPWGKIVAELGGDKGVDWEGVDKRWDDECEIGLAEVDLEMCERVRREVPLVGRERYEVE